jgi:hypothetical protein
MPTFVVSSVRDLPIPPLMKVHHCPWSSCTMVAIAQRQPERKRWLHWRPSRLPFLVFHVLRFHFSTLGCKLECSGNYCERKHKGATAWIILRGPHSCLLTNLPFWRACHSSEPSTTRKLRILLGIFTADFRGGRYRKKGLRDLYLSPTPSNMLLVGHNGNSLDDPSLSSWNHPARSWPGGN